MCNVDGDFIWPVNVDENINVEKNNLHMRILLRLSDE